MSPFLAGFALSLSLCLDLGLVNVALMRTALLRGFLPAFVLGLGSTLGDLVYAGLSLTGIVLLLRVRGARMALWAAGTLALLWLAARMIRGAARAHALEVAPSDEPRARGLGGDLVTGVGLALSSPSAILWFATAGGSLIAASASRVGAALPFFVGFAAASLLWSAVLARIVAAAHGRLGERLTRGLSLASAALFLLLAAKTFVDGYRDLVAR
jgi:L-lysine exporter family protein LysE/ArgO